MKHFRNESWRIWLHNIKWQLAKISNQLYKIVGLTLFLAVGISFQGCHPAYVTIEPTYSEGVRPARPSSKHVWIDGEWAFDHRKHEYVRNAGYWSMPNRSHTFVPGRWERNERGSRWVSGRWQKSKS